MADDQTTPSAFQKFARYSKYDVAMYAAKFMANKQGGSKSTKEDATSTYFTMVRNKISGSAAAMGDKNDISKLELLAVITEVEKAATNKFFPDALRAQSRLILDGLRAASAAIDRGDISEQEVRATGASTRPYGHLSSRSVSGGAGRVVSAASVREEKAKAEEGDAKPAKRTAAAKPPRSRSSKARFNPETAEQELQTAWDELVTLLNPENKTGKDSPYGMKWLNQEGLEKVIAWKDSSRAAAFPPLNTALREAGSEHAEKARELLSRINKLCAFVKQQRAEKSGGESAITLVSSVSKPVDDHLPTMTGDVVPLVDAETISHALRDVKRVSQSFSDTWREVDELFKGQYTGGTLEMFGLDNPQLALSFITRDKFKALVEPYRGALDDKRGDELLDRLIATHAQFRDLPGVREGRIVA
jgi:hypothetical protein